MAEDERFKHVSTDPKFRRIPKNVHKVKIDKRFRGMFNDEKFKVKYTVDKRGRPVSHSSTSDLKRYYDVSSDSESSDHEDSEVGKFVRSSKGDEISDLETTQKDDKPVSGSIQKKLKDLSVDYARGEANLNSESSSDDETEDEDDSDIEHDWGELDKDADKTDEITNRLAVCNMDWDRIRAVDMMVLFNSFLPQGGLIRSVTIYPSEFGMKRMQEEDVKGPIELVENNSSKHEEENEEGSKYHMEKLRQYQLNRLKYYYGVIVFDSPESANKIYTECDGLEYESSATKIDLRFIPDDTSFDQEPKETCDKVPDMTKYKPRFFTTTALQQAKVELTWDETNPKRVEIAKKLSDGKVDDVTDADLETYLASSGSEDENDEEEEDSGSDQYSDNNPIEKYRALLADLDKSNKKDAENMEMEITWGLNVKENTEKIVKKKLEENEEKTPFQKYLEKRKEKRKMKREERKKLEKTSEDEVDSDMDVDMKDPYFAEEFKTNKKEKHKKKSIEENKESNEDTAQLEFLLDDDDDGRKHFNLKDLENKDKTSKKKKNKNNADTKDDGFEVNVKDARFSAIYNSYHYNIDPTDPNFHKTKGMEALVEEKQKRVHQDCNDADRFEPPPDKKLKRLELNSLVNSVKRKTKNLINKK